MKDYEILYNYLIDRKNFLEDKYKKLNEPRLNKLNKLKEIYENYIKNNDYDSFNIDEFLFLFTTESKLKIKKQLTYIRENKDAYNIDIFKELIDKIKNDLNKIITDRIDALSVPQIFPNEIEEANIITLLLSKIDSVGFTSNISKDEYEVLVNYLKEVDLDINKLSILKDLISASVKKIELDRNQVEDKTKSIYKKLKKKTKKGNESEVKPTLKVLSKEEEDIRKISEILKNRVTDSYELYLETIKNIDLKTLYETRNLIGSDEYVSLPTFDVDKIYALINGVIIPNLNNEQNKDLINKFIKDIVDSFASYINSEKLNKEQREEERKKLLSEAKELYNYVLNKFNNEIVSNFKLKEKPTEQELYINDLINEINSKMHVSESVINDNRTFDAINNALTELKEAQKIIEKTYDLILINAFGNKQEELTAKLDNLLLKKLIHKIDTLSNEDKALYEKAKPFVMDNKNDEAFLMLDSSNIYVEEIEILLKYEKILELKKELAVNIQALENKDEISLLEEEYQNLLNLTNSLTQDLEKLEEIKKNDETLEEDLKSNTPRSIIFARRGQNDSYIMNDIKTMFSDKRACADLVTCLNNLKNGIVDTNPTHERQLGDNRKMKGLHEKKAYQMRLIYRTDIPNVAYVILAFQKKTYSDIKTKGLIEERKKNTSYEYQKLLKCADLSERIAEDNELFNEIVASLGGVSK